MVNWHKVVTGSFATLFLLLPLIWLPTTSELFEFNKIIAVYLFTAVIVAAWVGRMIAEKRWIFTRSLLDIPLAVFLGVSLLATVFSVDIHVSWYGYYSRWNGGFLTLVAYSVLYWAFVANMDRKGTDLAIKSGIAGAVITSVYGALEHFGFSPSCLVTRGTFGVDCWVQDVQTRVFATLGQPNWLAAYLVALIWLPISRIVKSTHIKINLDYGSLIVAILIFVCLLFTKSRSGLLAFGISAGVYWGLTFLKAGTTDKNLVKVFASFAAGVMLLTFGIPNPIRDLVITSAEPAPVGPALEVGGTESGSIRKIVWTGAYRIWTGSTKNFLLGTGPETFAEVYYHFRPVEHNQTSEWELLYNKAHNEFLNQLATTGIVGTLAYVWLLIAMIRQLLVKNTDQPGLQLALLAGWVSIPITNFWGFSTVTVQVLMFLLPGLAATSQVLNKSGKPTPALSVGQLIGIACALAGAGYISYLAIQYWRADTKLAAATNAIKSFQVSSQPDYLIAAYQLYSQAFTLNPAEPAISSELSVSAAYVANSIRQADATAAGQLAQIAVAASDKAISTSPQHPNYYKSRARAMILLSDVDPRYLQLAAVALEKAQTISPTDPRIPHNLGVVYEYLSATPSAIMQYNHALELKPDFADPKKQLEDLVKE